MPTPPPGPAPVGDDPEFVASVVVAVEGKTDTYHVWRISGVLGLYVPAREITNRISAAINGLPVGGWVPPVLVEPVTNDLPAWTAKARAHSLKTHTALAEMREHFGD